MQETPEPDAASQESASFSNNNNKNHSSSNEDVQMTTATSEDDAAAVPGEMKPDLIGDLTNLKNERNVSGIIGACDVADVKAAAETAPDSPPERAPLRRPFAAGSGADGGPVASGVEKGELDLQVKEQAADNE